jgi:hypothetical protein
MILQHFLDLELVVGFKERINYSYGTFVHLDAHTLNAGWSQFEAFMT